MLFSSRKEAGQQLAGRLAAFADRSDVVVLSLVPGGVPVGFEISQNLHLSFDILPIFKFYSPYNKNNAFGAISLNEISYIDHELVEKDFVNQFNMNHLESEAKFELEKLNLIYRGGKSWVNLEDKVVIIADDGTCLEEDIYFAIKIIMQQEPKGLMLASPILSSNLLDQFDENVENIVCIAESENDFKIENFYKDMSQVSDHEINFLFEKKNSLRFLN